MFEDLDTAVYLIFNGFYANWLDEYHATVLHAACAGGRLDLVKKLIEYGCDKRIVDSSGNLAIDYARHLGYDDIVAYLNSVK